MIGRHFIPVVLALSLAAPLAHAQDASPSASPPPAAAPAAAAQPAPTAATPAATTAPPAPAAKPADSATPVPPVINLDDIPGGDPDPKLRPVDFTRDPYMSSPRISPDGTHIAWIEDGVLVIYDPRDKSEKDIANNNFSGVTWINNDDLVATLQGPKLTIGGLNLTGLFAFAPMIYAKDGTYIRPLFATKKGDVDFSSMAPVIRFAGGDHPYAIVSDGYRAWSIDIMTGKRTNDHALMSGDYHAFDSNGDERVAVKSKEDKVSYGFTTFTFRYRDTAGKTQTLKLPRQDQNNIYYINFDYSEAENSIYWSQFDFNSGLASIYRFDIATGAQTLFKTSDDKDINIVLDQKGRVIGTRTDTDRTRTDWTDPAYQTLMASVEKLFPTATVDIIDMSDDGKQAVFLISAPENPDAYYQYDAQSHILTELGTNYPELDGEPLAPMTYITYKARDGLEIPAYVTKRKDTPANAPLIVVPHGGPAYRDEYGFDYEAQYLASKGYVVLQPQYRGSAGFGDAFERAGNLHMAEMTTDLEDGVRYLAAQGTINPKKVCVVGWSWGGYLAQAALTLTPDTYVCGISGDGVADLLQAVKAQVYWGGHVSDYWRTIIGNPSTNADAIRAVSPINHIDAIKAPLMLIHGNIDFIVDPRQSEQMNAAMKKAGKDVTYIPVNWMMHGPGTAEERLTLLRDMDDFIAKAFGTYVPPAPAKDSPVTPDAPAKPASAP